MFVNNAFSGKFIIQFEKVCINSLNAYKTLVEDSLMNLGTNDDYQYQAFYTLASQRNYGKFEQVTQFLLNGNVASAIGINNSIAPTNVMESNLQVVNSVSFERMQTAQSNNLSDFTAVSSSQYNTLYDIATQNPVLGGEAVYAARTMLWMDVDNSAPEDRNMIIKPKPIAPVSKYKLYPNPNTGNMTLEYTLESTDIAVFSIYSMDGRLVKQQTLNAQNNIANIDAVNLDSGIYYYTVKEGNKNTKSEKLIIIK